MQSSRFLGALTAVALFLTGVLSNAAPASAQNYNFGGPGAANVSVANGNVEIIRADSGAQIPASINATLVPGDYIATGSGSDAEVQFDGATMLRLAGNTQVRLVNMNPGSREAQLAAGTADIAVLQGSGGERLDTPSLSVTQNQDGDTRVSVLNNGESLVTVRSGSATVSDANGSQTLTPGETLAVNGSYVNMQNAVGFDSFDQFNSARDQAVASAYNANPYLSPYLAGYSNLANYGQWQNVPGYGYAWAPYNQNQNNFAPYQNGQWVWEPGYGYTWVDNSPYGYTTSHYGTWFNNPNYGGWLWQPPAYQNQYTPTSLASDWLPAVVSLFLTNGSGGGFGGGLGGVLGNLLGFLGGGNSNAMIGWIPLAPGEQYTPWYGSNYSYPQTSMSTVTNVTNVYNYYTNARYYRGIQMVPVNDWRSGNFRAVRPVRATQIRQMAFIRGAVPVVPTTANLHYTTTRAGHPVTLVRAFSAPRLAARAPATHVTFAAQQSRIRSIATVRPHIATLAPRHAVASHPVYQPARHAPIHITALKPVQRKVTTQRRTTQTHAQTVPMRRATPRPAMVHRAPARVQRPPAPVHRVPPTAGPRPAARPAPVPRPAVVHTARPAPAARPAVVHTARPAPAARPAVVHTARPAPAARPAVVHPAPAPHPAAAHPAPAQKPAPHATSKPAPKATPDRP